MCENVRCLSLKRNYRLTRNSLSGFNKIVWVNSWIFRQTLQLVANVHHLPTNFISPQISILFLMICLKQWIGPVLMNCRWVYLPWTISIEYWIMNSLQNKNSMKLIMLFTSPLPYICLAWWSWTSTGNKDCIQQRRRFDDPMCERNQAIKRIIPTPVNTGKDANNDPDM